MDAPDVLAYRLEEARLTLEQAGCEITRVVRTGAEGEPSSPLRVLRQRCLSPGKVELVVAPEILVRLTQ